MNKIFLLFMAAVIFALAGCASAAKPVKIKVEVPPPQTGESAVFGRLSVVELVNDIYAPVNEIDDGAIYMKQEGVDKIIKIKCSDSGEFGVYLPGATYYIFHINANDYSFETDMRLTVPPDQKAVYAGTIVLDDTPAGIVRGKDETKFAYTVKDEQKDYETSIRKQIPTVEVRFYKSLFTPRGGLMSGDNPSKVHRAKDVENSLRARTDAVEEAVMGVVYTIPYIINPVWLFTYPF